MRYRGERRTGLIARLVRALGPRSLVAWALLLIVAFSMASGLAESVPSLNVAFIFSISAVGLTLGWLLAQLPMKAWFAALLIVIFGVEFLLIRVGGLEQDVWEAVKAVGQVVDQLVRWYWTKQPPDWGIVPTHFSSLWRDVGTLIGRTSTWLYGLLAGRGGWDVIGSALIWGLGIWLYNAWSGWVVRRNNHPLLGVLPGAVLLSFVLSYTGSNPYIFLPILGITLVLMALMRQQARESRWLSRGVDFSQGLWSDVAMVATGLSIALVLAAAVAPSISAEKIADWVREVTDRGDDSRTEQVAEGLGLEQRAKPRPVRPLQSMESTRLPQEHLIGSGPELSRSVVMVVETGELPPYMPEGLTDYTSAPRHYWRSITYDHYFGRGWATSGTETIKFEAGEEATDLDAPHLRTLRQNVRLVSPSVGGRVHVDGTLVSVDQEFSVAFRPPGEIFGATLEARREYRADSVYPLVTVEDLRSASLDYPDWILSRYLQLPDTVPDRVVDLARELTATEPTPYDRAKAIEQYLREFPYNLDVPRPGAQTDIADFFLFELQEGYCDYYATSMVVLARAAGLPARLVIGYVSGQYDPVVARYVVTEADAHAWPEIYFPEYGWIEFEPTGGRAPITRSGSSSDEGFEWPERQPVDPLVSRSREPSKALTVGVAFMAAVGGIALVIIVLTGIDSAALWFSPPEKMAARLYRRLTKHARRLRIRIRTGDTPHELLDRWVSHLRRVVEEHGSAADEFVEPAIDEIEALIALYTTAWYSRDPEITPAQRRQAVWTWWRLQWRLWLAWFWRGSVMAEDIPARQRVRSGGLSSVERV